MCGLHFVKNRYFFFVRRTHHTQSTGLDGPSVRRIRRWVRNWARFYPPDARREHDDVTSECPVSLDADRVRGGERRHVVGEPFVEVLDVLVVPRIEVDVGKM